MLLPLMPTIRKCIRPWFQQQAEDLGGRGAGGIVHAAGSPPRLEGVADVVDRQLSSHFAYLRAAVGVSSVSGPRRACSRELFQKDFLLARRTQLRSHPGE
jgi:hypothetical protein